MNKRVWDHQGSSHERGYGWRWQQRRKAFLATHPLCVRCEAAGRVVAATDLDHIVPKAKGGTDDASNLQPLCRACHEAKTIDEDGPRRRRIGTDGYPSGD